MAGPHSYTHTDRDLESVVRKNINLRHPKTVNYVLCVWCVCGVCVVCGVVWCCVVWCGVVCVVCVMCVCVGVCWCWCVCLGACRCVLVNATEITCEMKEKCLHGNHFQHTLSSETQKFRVEQKERKSLHDSHFLETTHIVHKF